MVVRTCTRNGLFWNCKLTFMWCMNRIFLHQMNNEFCSLLRYYTAKSGNSIPTVWDNLWAPSSMVKQSSFFFFLFFFLDCWPLKRGSIGCPEMPTQNYHSTLCKIPEECISHLHCGRSLKSCRWITVKNFAKTPHQSQILMRERNNLI